MRRVHRHRCQQQIEFTFAYGGQSYQAVAVHDATATADDFHMEQFKTTRTTVGGPLTGAFDKKASEVRVVVLTTGAKTADARER